MRRRTICLPLISGVVIGLLFMLTAFQPGTPLQQTILYDGALGGTPDTQGFTYVAFAESASQAYAGGVTTLDTTPIQSDQAGYFANEHPSLDRQTGYTVQFSMQLLAEVHASQHRAGFSLIVLSSDLRGIELGFWPDEIWAQEGGISALFTHAEGVSFDPTSALTEYELHISGDSYTLKADGAEILTGPLRDYTAFGGILDPYETPNLLFLGDNTSRGQAKVNIAFVALRTVAPATGTPSPSGTITKTPTPEKTATPTASAIPTATSTIAPTLQPTRSWPWWWPLTAGYPSR